MEEDKEMRIFMGEDKLISREKLFESKANFHREQARLPFEEKIKILVRLQKIASGVKGKEGMVWEI